MAATDYSTKCGGVALSFIQMIASTIVGYHIGEVMHYRINGVEASADCAELSDFLNCNMSHTDPESQLVENTFALDECGRLAWKIFSNTDNDWNDYSECGEVPKTFLELLARTIATYSNSNYINAHIDTGICTSLTTLLDCNTNNIESERLLVANIFAVDDCDRLLIKFFANQSTMTDYHIDCAVTPQTFYQLLARCIVKYNGHYYINTASVSGFCQDLHDFWTCAINHIDPERTLVENVFVIDSCGNLALKIFNNGGDSR